MAGALRVGGDSVVAYSGTIIAFNLIWVESISQYQMPNEP